MYLNWEVFNTAMIHWKFLKSIHKLLLLLLRLFYNNKKKKTKIKPNNLTSYLSPKYARKASFSLPIPLNININQILGI